MTKLTGFRYLPLLSLFVVALIMFGSRPAAAQTNTKEPQSSVDPKREDETNLETQLYLLLGSNTRGGEERLPPALAPVLTELKSTLPFSSYGVVTTLLNRIRNGGRLSLRWIGNQPLAGAAASFASYNDFKIEEVKLSHDANGRGVIHMVGFYFGARVPIQTATTLAANGGPGAPVVNYENTGINTDISMFEGEPVVVGTLKTGPSGEALILVVSARKTPR